LTKVVDAWKKESSNPEMDDGLFDIVERYYSEENEKIVGRNVGRAERSDSIPKPVKGSDVWGRP
jgi:hypothetical protein